MEDRRLQIELGTGALIAAVFLLLVAIPTWVSSPSNVANIVLSPAFWPNVLAGCTAMVGLGMILTSWWQPKPPSARVSDVDHRGTAFARLAIVAIIMSATLIALPQLGLVWTCMLVFASVAFLVKTRHPKTVLICAVIVPLVLYVFFAHVAGVSIPQGNFVRLP
jgi:hypothetical protein